MSNSWIPTEDWHTIVEHVPIVSVDLLVVEGNRLLLAKRQNEPAKGEWFVPGGRVRKGEARRDAVHRVANEELDTAVRIEQSLGAFEHFYETSAVADSVSKQYLANGYVVRAEGEVAAADDQHSELRWVRLDELPNLHEHVTAYVEAADL